MCIRDRCKSQPAFLIAVVFFLMGVLYSVYLILITILFFQSSGGLVKRKVNPTLPRTRYMPCASNPTLPSQQQLTLLLPDARAFRTELIPRDPVRWRYIATRRCPRLRVLARTHPLTKTQAMPPSRRTRSSFGTPTRWCVSSQL